MSKSNGTRKTAEGKKKAGAGEAASLPPMKRKEYEHDLRRLHGELVAMQEWVKSSGAKIVHRLRRPRHRGQGRDDQGHHRAGEPAGVPGRGAAGPERP